MREGHNNFKIEHLSLEQKVEVNGVMFKFSAKHRYNITGKLGLYNRSHTTSKHRGPIFSIPDTNLSDSEKNEAP